MKLTTWSCIFYKSIHLNGSHFLAHVFRRCPNTALLKLCDVKKTTANIKYNIMKNNPFCRRTSPPVTLLYLRKSNVFGDILESQNQTRGPCNSGLMIVIYNRVHSSLINKSLRTLFLISTFFLYAGSYRVLHGFL